MRKEFISVIVTENTVFGSIHSVRVKKKQGFYKGLIRLYLKHFPFKAEMVKL